ncbi:unnamed protein product [Schistocephalus solidus]|uniref:Reverse transcriptase domain-containing protein n=1 Tax=Schistocephalus solidus TaxID=70667 RepID=A0A183SNX8_SCHSO|nr:unnamed protein product [Schistocephalus solidus]
MWLKDKFLRISKTRPSSISTCGKGNRQLYDNHRGISLSNIAGEIFARTLLNRLDGHIEQGLLPESQCGFCRLRGTTGMIFSVRQL